MLSVASAQAKTLIVEGKLDGTVTVKKNITFTADQTISRFTYQFSVPSTYDNAGNVQRLDDIQVSAIPQPTESKEITDQYGNRSHKLTWNKLQGDAQVSILHRKRMAATSYPINGRQLRPPKPV
jgi:hypothetical protein